MKRISTLLTCSLALAINAARAQDSSAQKQNKQLVASSAPATAGSVSGSSATSDPNYVIGAEDVLDINVWKETDLTRSVPVRPDGKISLPLLNDIQAAGLTPMQLSSQIAASLNKYVNNPQVTVIVSQINSQRVYILGEVSRAGAYPLIPGMTVLQAIANAGSFTQYANSKKIYVLRQDGGKQQKLFFNYKQVIAGKNIQQNIELKPGDTIVVP